MRSRDGAIMRSGVPWWSRPWIAAGVLLVCCLAVYLPGLTTIPVIDRDEARFAQASRQMLESGDWVIPRVQDTPRLNKPPLIYWLQASSAWVLTGRDVSRDAIWMYRIPSVLAAIGTVFIVWRLAWRVSGASVAFLAASLLAVCPLIAFDAHQARSDQLMAFCTTAAMACLWECWRYGRRGERAPWGWAIGFWLSVSAGIMTKGPITLVVVGLAVVAISVLGRSVRWFGATRPAAGVVLTGLMVAPWVVAVARAVGFENYLALVWKESAGRAAGSSEGHLAPPGTHTVLLIALFWPGSLTTAKAVVKAVGDGWVRRSEGPGLWKRVWPRGIGTPTDAFLLAWLVPAWVFFELFGAKLAHYPMPLYPAMAILSARGAAWMDARRVMPTMLDRTIWLAVGFALALAGLAASGYAAAAGRSAGAIAGVVIAAGAVVVLVISRRSGTVSGLLRGARWAMVLIAVTAFTAGARWLPGAEAANIMNAVRAIEGWEGRPIASTHKQDSMVFHTRGRVARLNVDEVRAWAEAHPGAVVVVRADEVERAGLRGVQWRAEVERAPGARVRWRVGVIE